METLRQDKETRLLFLIGVYGKGFLSLLEVVGAVFAYFVPVSFVASAHSLLIIALILFDLVVIYLIWRKYLIVRRYLHA